MSTGGAVVIVCKVCGSDEMHSAHEAPVERQGSAPPAPVVLRLPEVPAGAVALITEDGTRFVPHGNQGGHSWWQSDSRGTFSLARILSELGQVTVEFAPPREPRVWPQLDGAPADLPYRIEVDGMRFRRCVGADSYVHEATAGIWSWHMLLAQGEVREVLEP